MENAKKRTFVVCDYDGNGEISGSERRVPLMTAKEAYDYTTNKGGKWSVEMYAPKCFGLDYLLKVVGDGNWFYDNGKNEITLVLDLTDDYYRLAEDKFSDETLGKVWDCFRLLQYKGCCTKDDVVYFKRVENRYHLYAKGKDLGYLDKSNQDMMFKDMLSSIFNEKDVYYEVIVFPTESKNFFFENTVVAYNTIEDFEKAQNSWLGYLKY